MVRQIFLCSLYCPPCWPSQLCGHAESLTTFVILLFQGYVERETALIGSLTVREFLYYSALLQLPGFLFQKKSAVEDAIVSMSLGDYANKLIGGHCYMKGLPSGERRRVSIARELVMRPHILFIDEPLYHLDRLAALHYPSFSFSFFFLCSASVLSENHFFLLNHL